MRQGFRLGGGGIGKAVAQNLCDAVMQDLAAALGCVSMLYGGVLAI
jgi:hypothetical protein